jgi:hypothetical protein
MTANELFIKCEKCAKNYTEKVLKEDWDKVWDYEVFNDYHFSHYADLLVNKIDFEVYSEEQMLVEIITFVTQQLTSKEDVKNGYGNNSRIGKMLKEN